MKPRIVKQWNGWQLQCRQHRRSFDLFGADAAERLKLQTLPQTFKTWPEAIEHLAALYKQRQIIR
jgi:hypothetical protein